MLLENDRHLLEQAGSFERYSTSNRDDGQGEIESTALAVSDESLGVPETMSLRLFTRVNCYEVLPRMI